VEPYIAVGLEVAYITVGLGVAYIIVGLGGLYCSRMGWLIYLFEFQYRTSLDTNFIVINIRNFERKSRNAKKSNEVPFPTPKINNKFITISKDKKRDIESMISWCPTEDQTYLENFRAN
jgi:hypothetical protein